MTTALKTQIVEATKGYMADKGLTATQLATLANINGAYISTMLNGKTAVKDTEIADRYYNMLAATVGLPTKKAYWETVPTTQFLEVIAELEDCKKNSKPGFIVASTGSGKTYAIDAFIRKNPLHTYRITANDLYTLGDIINELADVLSIDVMAVPGRLQEVQRKFRLTKISQKLTAIRDAGGLPIIIIDEAENLKRTVLRLVKALYDSLQDTCSIVLIGTNELEMKLQPTSRNKSWGMPQLYSRFRAYRKEITPLSGNYNAFFDKLGIQGASFRALIASMAPTYRELRDYLRPAIQEADEKNIPLTEEFFRLKYNLPTKKLK